MRNATWSRHKLTLAEGERILWHALEHVRHLADKTDEYELYNAAKTIENRITLVQESQ